MPLAFWTEKDIWDYIRKYYIPHSFIYDMGYKRTGCMFCMYGVQREEHPNKFELMNTTHPKLYKYCMENLGIQSVLDFIDDGK
jgi:3'-phosphoadenosine 5'-phosphosulfate sulfotransferase (PAPS reductase)/FAD synthetase